MIRIKAASVTNPCTCIFKSSQHAEIKLVKFFWHSETDEKRFTCLVAACKVAVKCTGAGQKKNQKYNNGNSDNDFNGQNNSQKRLQWKLKERRNDIR